MAVDGGLLIHLDVALDGIVAIELAENAFHDNLRALLRGKEPIAGLQFTNKDRRDPIRTAAVIVLLHQHDLTLHIAPERDPTLALRCAPRLTEHGIGNR